MSLLAPVFGYVIDKYGRRDIYTFVSGGVFLLAFVILAVVPIFLIGFVCVLIGLSFAAMNASIWSSISVIVRPAVVGVAMGVGLGAQAFGGGLFLLITGFVLDDKTATVLTRWTNFSIVSTVFAGVAWILCGISIYVDSRDGKKLRMKHVIPSVEAEMLEDLDELTPLVDVVFSRNLRKTRHSIRVSFIGQL